MRLNYGQPFQDEERLGYREVMAANALQRLVVLLLVGCYVVGMF